MVEVWPFMERSRGIAVFQLFGRLAGFFTTFVNPIGLENIQWKWLVVYCCWLAYEFLFVYFMFPETANRTLEELAFCKSILVMDSSIETNKYSVFEGEERANVAAEAAEKATHVHSDTKHV